MMAQARKEGGGAPSTAPAAASAAASAASGGGAGRGAALKESGNAMYRKGEYAEALRLYTQAIWHGANPNPSLNPSLNPAPAPAPAPTLTTDPDH